MPIYTRKKLADELKQQITRIESNAAISKTHRKEMEGLFSLLPDSFLSQLPRKSGHVPLLLVLPYNVLSFEAQLALAVYTAPGTKTSLPAYSFLSKKRIVESTTSKKPYLLLGVETGKMMLDVSPEDAMVRLREFGRTAFGVKEGLALAIHRPQIFDRHNIHCSASLYASEFGEFFTPDFFRYARRIKLKRDGGKDADPNWGTPSFRTLVAW